MIKPLVNTLNGSLEAFTDIVVPEIKAQAKDILKMTTDIDCSSTTTSSTMKLACDLTSSLNSAIMEQLEKLKVKLNETDARHINGSQLGNL